MKKRLILLVIGLCMIPALIFAGETIFVSHLRPSDYEAITVADTAIGFTASKLVTAVAGAFCTLETGQVRFRMDGSDPTSTTGHLLEVGQSFTIYNRAALVNIKFIRTGSTSGALKVTYLSE